MRLWIKVAKARVALGFLGFRCNVMWAPPDLCTAHKDQTSKYNSAKRMAAAGFASHEY